MQQFRKAAVNTTPGQTTPGKQSINTALSPPAGKQKLTYKEQRELEAIPEKIDTLETEQSKLTEALSAAGLYQDHPQKARELNDRLQQISTEVDQLMERWADLEA